MADDDRESVRREPDGDEGPNPSSGSGGIDGEELDPLASLEGEVEAAWASETQLRDQLLRLAAEFDNYRKRSLREAEVAAHSRTDALAGDLLEVLDNFERGLQADIEGNGARAFREGMELVYKRMREILARHGVEELNPEGHEFDPRLHEAIHAAREPGVPPNRVLQVAQKGYRISGRLLRPARVVVSK